MRTTSSPAWNGNGGKIQTNVPRKKKQVSCYINSVCIIYPLAYFRKDELFKRVISFSRGIEVSVPFEPKDRNLEYMKDTNSIMISR